MVTCCPNTKTRTGSQKIEFRDALRLRYNLRLDNLPSDCVCGETFGVYHALSCKRGGFIAQRHDELRNLFAIKKKRIILAQVILLAVAL